MGRYNTNPADPKKRRDLEAVRRSEEESVRKILQEYVDKLGGFIVRCAVCYKLFVKSKADGENVCILCRTQQTKNKNGVGSRVITKECKYCGSLFTTTRREAMYCSRTCYVRSYKPKLSPPPKKCLNCKTPFTSRAKHQRFCSRRCSSSYHQRDLTRRLEGVTNDTTI